MEQNKIDSVLEQCTWVSVYNLHGKRNLCFNVKNGIILYQREEVGKPFNHNNIAITGTAEEIYKEYLDTIKVSKEKAFINNKNAGMFDTHRLMRQRYSSDGGQVYHKLLETHPELFI